MATIAAKGIALNMLNLDVTGFLDYNFSEVGPDQARYFDDADNYLLLTGNGLQYDSQDNPVSGVMTGSSTVEAGVEILRFSGLSLEAGETMTILQAGNLAALWDAMLSGNDIIKGSNLSDVLLGNRGNDRISGNSGNDMLRGEAGSDILLGGNGRDTLVGANGNDQLNGELGSDKLNGGAGADSFIFSTALGATNVDTIQDFDVAADQIKLSAAVFTDIGLPGRVLAGQAFHIGARAHDQSDRIVYNSTTGALYFDEDGNDDGIAPVLFATLEPGLALSAADFLII